jgi:hypothetical protein
MENINMKKNKIILIVVLVLSLSANAGNDEAGLLILKQLENLSDERIVLPFKRNPYYQCF